MGTKILNFLTTTKFGLFLLINTFFVAGLLGADGLFLGGLLWFGGNVVIMWFAFNAKKEVPPAGRAAYPAEFQEEDHQDSIAEDQQT